MANWGGIGTGAASGAATGSAFGPWGAGVGAGLGALVGFLSGSGSDSNKPVSPEVERMLELEYQRQMRANPLVEQVMRSAFSRLPESARAGLSIEPFTDIANEQDTRLAPHSRTQDPFWIPIGEAGMSAVDQSGDYAQSPAMRRLIRLQMMRMRMADPIIQAVQRLAQARMPSASSYASSYAPPGSGGTTLQDLLHAVGA